MDVARVFVARDQVPRLHEESDETHLDDNGTWKRGPAGSGRTVGRAGVLAVPVVGSPVH